MPKEKVGPFITEQRKMVIGFLINKHKVSEENAEEAFYRGCHAMLENIHSGKFIKEEHEGSLAKYLHTCCENQLLKMFKIASRNISDDDVPDWPDESGDKVQMETDLELMESIVEDLGSPCQELIWGRYGDKFSAQEMAYRLGYSSSRVAITTLSRCMQRLRNRFFNERKQQDEE